MRSAGVGGTYGLGGLRSIDTSPIASVPGWGGAIFVLAVLIL